MPRIEIGCNLHEVQDCPRCGRTVFVTGVPAVGFLATCGRRLVNYKECSAAQCVLDDMGSEQQET